MSIFLRMKLSDIVPYCPFSHFLVNLVLVYMIHMRDIDMSTKINMISLVSELIRNCQGKLGKDKMRVTNVLLKVRKWNKDKSKT